ncbi:MAG: SprT-like domain-containing protein [Deltaproteobacteria bacterium]|nr:SprT-like domain-containing protein [Deltaproteobacteria bacterium]
MSLRLHVILKKILKGPVRLTVTDNTHVFLNASYRKKIWHVRLHWMFAKASPAVQQQAAQYILNHNKKSSKVIDQFIEDHWHWVRHPLPPIVVKGKIYNLESIFSRLNRRFFRKKLKSKITWGKSGGRQGYEQLQMGSYSTSRDLITVHPSLDQKKVPHYVVESTVFHEMCHAVIPVQKINGRKQIHPPAFKKMEAQYPHLKKAQKWEEENLGTLLRKSRRR